MQTQQGLPVPRTLKNNDNSYKGHVGLVTEVLNNNLVKTIEGNTNFGGSREGEGVFELTRTMEIGKPSKVDGNGAKILRGYIRRNFTKEELSKLSYDDKAKTLIFSTPNLSNLFYGIQQCSI